MRVFCESALGLSRLSIGLQRSKTCVGPCAEGADNRLFMVKADGPLYLCLPPRLHRPQAFSMGAWFRLKAEVVVEAVAPGSARCGLVGIPVIEVIPHPQAALGEHLVDMAIHSFHLCKDLINEPAGDVFVEEIPHGVDEDHPWPAPLRRLLQP